MNIKKYQFGDNFIYEVEDLNEQTYVELGNMVTSENTLVSIYEDDFKYLCEGYSKLLIGLGKITNVDDLLNLFDLYKDSTGLIVQLKSEVLYGKQVEELLTKVKNFFNKDINIIYGVDQTSSIYDVIIFLPIIRK